MNKFISFLTVMLAAGVFAQGGTYSSPSPAERAKAVSKAKEMQADDAKKIAAEGGAKRGFLGGAANSGLTKKAGSLGTDAAKADAGDEALTADEAPPFNWDQTELDIVLQSYGDAIGKTVLKDPGTPAPKITLKSMKGQKLTQDEYLEAIEVVLEMNGVHLEPYGEKFVRAVPRAKARKVVGMPVFLSLENVPKDTKPGTVISVRLVFKYIGIEEAQKVLEGFKSDSGQLQAFERTNSILVTDLYENILRMSEVVKSIDEDNLVTENVFHRQIKYASAQDIKTILEAIVQESQKELEKNKTANIAKQKNTAPAATQVNPARNILLPGRNQNQNQQPAEVNEAQVAGVSDADRGMIRGKVVILADERSNKLVIITQDANMKFFDKVINELDIETTPDTVVKVYRLKYADAEDVADMINDLIGNSGKASGSKGKGNQNANAKKGTSGNMTSGRNNQQKKSVNQRSGEPKAGELSKDNTTVLADKRINGLVVMTDKELIPTLQSIIESMDVKLSQVLIETVIVEVTLSKDIKTGVDWISGLKSGGNQAMASGDSSSKLRITGESVDVGKLATDAIATVPAAQGIGYFANIKDLDLSLIISASKTDSRSKYLASPVVMTLDNKEATIDATTKKQFITGWQAVSSSYAGSGLPSPTYSSTDIGLKVKVTPKINPNGTVMLEVEEEYTQVAGKQDMLVPNTTSGSGSSYATQQVEVPTTRKMSSDVILENMQTVVFGGLVESYRQETEGGIPILKDIPYVGKWLFGKVEHQDARTELLVFMTPYVMDNGMAAQNEARRRKLSMSDERPWEDNGWSASSLADPVSAKEQLRKQKAEWNRLDEEYESGREMDKLTQERIEKLMERERDEAEANRKVRVSVGREPAKVAPAEAKPVEPIVEQVSPEKRIEQERVRQLLERLKEEELAKPASVKAAEGAKAE